MSFAVWRQRPAFTFAEGDAEQIYQVGDVWVVTDDPMRATQAVVDAFLAAEAKEVAGSAIDAARDARLASETVAWNGRLWHVDNQFQSHLAAFISAFREGLLPAGAQVAIRSAGGTTEQLTLADLKALAGAVMVRVQQIWADSWAARDALP